MSINKKDKKMTKKKKFILGVIGVTLVGAGCFIAGNKTARTKIATGFKGLKSKFQKTSTTPVVEEKTDYVRRERRDWQPRNQFQKTNN